MAAPRYRKKTLARDIMDILRDAPGGEMQRSSLVRVLGRRRGVPADARLRNGVAQALLRMVRWGDAARMGQGRYKLTARPIPDRYDNAQEWMASE